MKKLRVAKKKVKTTKKKKAVIPVSDVTLPHQTRDDVQLIDTDTAILMGMSKPNLFRESVLEAKQKFTDYIEKLAAACNLKSEVRVYFTFTDLGKKE